MKKKSLKATLQEPIVLKSSASIFPMRFGTGSIGNDLFLLEFSDYNDANNTITILTSIVLHKKAMENLRDSLTGILLKGEESNANQKPKKYL